MIRGSVDAVSKKQASGWIYSDSQKEPVSVEAVINNQIVGTSVANLLRPDLQKAGFGEGRCGFEIQFKHEIDPAYLPFIQVRMAGTDLELRRWAGAGFAEFFRALYERYPNTGRSASVFGGLWTDRNDASALLKGRVDIGVLAPAEANCIARFIIEGAVVIALDAKPALRVGAERTKVVDLPAAVGEVLFHESLLRLTRGILDDNPVAIRADSVDSDQSDYAQMSTLEDLPSPAECVGLIFPSRDKTVAVEVVRGSHRFPEFLPDGLSRWTHAAAERTTKLSPDMPVDRHLVPKGSALLIGPGTLYRIRAAAGSAIRVLLLPSRLSLLRFHHKPPTGEWAHDSGARIWI